MILKQLNFDFSFCRSTRAVLLTNPGVPVRKWRHKLFKLLDTRLQQNVWKGHICDKSEAKSKCGHFIEGTLQNLEKLRKRQWHPVVLFYIFIYNLYIYTYFKHVCLVNKLLRQVTKDSHHYHVFFWLHWLHWWVLLTVCDQRSLRYRRCHTDPPVSLSLRPSLTHEVPEALELHHLGLHLIP